MNPLTDAVVTPDVMTAFDCLLRTSPRSFRSPCLPSGRATEEEVSRGGAAETLAHRN